MTMPPEAIREIRALAPTTSIAEIARRLCISPLTVRKYADPSVPRPRDAINRAIREMAADPNATACFIARTLGVAPATVLKHAGRPFLRRGQPEIKTDRNAAVVERYRSSRLNLAQVGAEFGITYERVRQIIARHEAFTGEVIPRKDVGARAPRTVVRCLNCGRERRYLACIKNLPRRCARCAALHNSICAEKPERARQFIEARRRLGTWTRALDEILGKRGDRGPEGMAYRYLASRLRWKEISELWPRGVAPWIVALYPKYPPQAPAFAKPKGTR